MSLKSFCKIISQTTYKSQKKHIGMERKFHVLFHVLIEQDEDGGYVGKVPELKGCLSQGDTLDELMKNIKEAIELCLEVEAEEKVNVREEQIKFVGIQEITL